MIIAMPTNKGVICKDFFEIEEFIFYEIESERVYNKNTVRADGKTGIDLMSLLEKNDADMFICNYLSSPEKNYLRQKRIEILSGVNGKADDIIIRYLSGENLRLS